MRATGALRSLRDDEEGISIVELMVAMVILGITMMGIALTVMNSLSLSRSNANRVVAANIAASEIDAHLALEFSDLLDRLGTTTLDDVEVDGRTFEVTRDIYWSTNEADLGPCISGTASAADENVIRIDIRVTWTRALGVHPVVSSTTVSPPVDTFGSAGGTIAVYVVDDDNEPMAGVSTRLFGPIEGSPTTYPVAITDENGCAVFEGLGIGSYRALIGRDNPSGQPPYVDIDQRFTPFPLATSHGGIDPSSVMSLTGVSPRSRVTTEFFYAQAHELTVVAEGWDGGEVPDAGFTWHFVNSRDAYVGGLLGDSRNVYPGSYEVWAGACEASDPLYMVTDEATGDENPRWPGATRDDAPARPAGEASTASVTFGTFDVTWAAGVVPDPDRDVTLQVTSGDAGCPSTEYELGSTTLGADARFALPWGAWTIRALEGGTVLDSDDVVLSPDDQGGTAPVVTLDVVAPPEPGPAGVVGPIVWFDADDAMSLTASGGAISQWRDQTSNERHASQAATANQPTYVAAQLNGRPVVRFGGDDWLAFDGSALAGTDYTVFAVNRRLSSGVHDYYLGGTENTSNRNLYLGYNVDAGQHYLRHSHWVHTHAQPVDSFALGEPARVHAFVFDQEVGKSVYQDGELLGTASAGNDRLPLDANEGAQLGRILSGTDAQYFHGDLAEMVIYDRALTPTERADVEAYLEAKWIATPSFSPPSLSGLQLWLDGADGVTLRQDVGCTELVTPSADRVRCWMDKSGNGRHATRDGGGTRPTAIPSRLNGLPALNFDGASQYLEYDGSFLAGGNYTIAVVSRRTGSGTNTDYNFYLGGQGSTNNNMNLYLGYRNNTRLEHGQWGNDYGTDIAGYAAGEPARVHTYTLNTAGGGGKRLFADGTQVASQGGNRGRTALSSYPNARIGRFLTSYFQGDIAEIVMYDRDLGDAERQQLELYLATKWGLS